MNRAVLTFPLVSLAAVPCCTGRVTRSECTQMLDHYIDMSVAGEPAPEGRDPAEARADRETKKTQRKSAPSYLRVQDQCEAEISRREYRCAMKAPTPETWQACID